MYKKEFDTLLNTKKIPKAVALYGLCNFQLKFYEEEILNIWGNEGVLKFYFDDYDFQSAKAHLSQSSLFGDKNILVLKVDKTLATKEVEALIELCGKSDINNFLLISFSDDAKTKTLIKPFGPNIVRFFKSNLGEAMNFLQNEAKKIELKISSFALQHLYLTHNEDLSLSINEFQKLMILDKEISTSDIDRLVYGMGEVSIEEFTIKLFDKKNILELYQSIIQSANIDEIRVINAIQSHLFQLFLFHAYIKANGTFDAIKILGYPLPLKLAKERAEQSIKIKLKIFSQLSNILAEAEYILKTNSNIDKESMLLSTLIKLQSYL